jgi:hypothetical protein
MSTLTALQIVTNAAVRIGTPVPAGLGGATDNSVTWLAALNLMSSLVTTMWDWTELQTEASFAGVAAQDQGLLTTLAPNFLRMIPDTFYNQTQKRKCNGPLNNEDWRYLQAVTQNGPFDNFRIRNKHLWVYPAPVTTDTYAFEYITTLVWGTATPNKELATVDADIFYLDGELGILGTAYAWKMTRGLEYGMEEAMFQTRFNSMKARDGTRRTIQLRTDNNRKPGVYFPVLVP